MIKLRTAGVDYRFLLVAGKPLHALIGSEAPMPKISKLKLTYIIFMQAENYG
ncbi:MAG: hypothetical protein HRU29_00835 [Rhizobiales bacterium]|nr:hypothetical protein [Hyphomicrobiales bacterium]NRB12918.1 hypothetical protein [Hyphomicrobiales bacterium]